MKKAVAAVLLVLMVCGLCACKKADKKPPLDLNNQNQSQTDEKVKGVTVEIQDCSDYTTQQKQEVYNWWQCPIDQDLYMLLYEDTDIAALYELPEVLDGYWIVDDYHNDSDGVRNVAAITARDTYNFVLFIYDNPQQKLYRLQYNNED